MEKESLIVGTSNGLLLLYTVDTNNATQPVVGNVEGGVNCISPSPDGELLAVITGFGQILVMTHDWDLLYEMPLHDQACHVSKDYAPFSTIFIVFIPSYQVYSQS